MASGVSKTEIFNRALVKIGSSPINAPDQDVDRARVLLSMYDVVRDSVLRDAPWNFASKRVEIAADAGVPVYEWTTQYLLPSDFILMTGIEQQIEYRIEGDFILTNQSGNIKIEYVFRNENTAKYDSLFVEALAAKLALESVERITQSNTKKEFIRSEYNDIIVRAKRQDGYEDKQDDYVEDSWILARTDVGLSSERNPPRFS